MSSSTLFSIQAVAAICIMLGGCTASNVTDAPQLDPTHERLMLIGLAYQEFNELNQRPPAKPEDLQEILNRSGADKSVWVSARDQQPFVIVWNVDVRQAPDWATSTPVLAYEAAGKSGNRLVRTLVGSVEELSATQFSQASFPPGHKP